MRVVVLAVAVSVLLLYAVHQSGKSEDGFGRRMGSCTQGNTQPMTRVMVHRFVIMCGLNENYMSPDESVSRTVYSGYCLAAREAF